MSVWSARWYLWLDIKKNDFYEIFALIRYQFFQMPFQYLSTELYEIIVSPTAGGMTIRQWETAISGSDEMR